MRGPFVSFRSVRFIHEGAAVWSSRMIGFVRLLTFTSLPSFTILNMTVAEDICPIVWL